MKPIFTKRDLEVKWSEWKFYVPVFVNFSISILCYYIGFKMSCKTSAMPLARAGAAVTAISIGFTLWNYKQILAQGEDRGAKAYETAVRILNLRYQSPGELTENFRKRLKRQTEKIDRNITWAQAILLIFATVVWGFGDLATVFFE